MTKDELNKINRKIKNNNFHYIKKGCEKLIEKGVVYTNYNSFRRYNPYTSNFDKISDKEVLEMFNNVCYNHWYNFNKLEIVKKHILRINVQTLENYYSYLQGNNKTDKAKKDFENVLKIIKKFR